MKINNIKKIAFVVLAVGLTNNEVRSQTVAFSASKIQPSRATGNVSSLTDNDIQHIKVFYEEGGFGGWPANHGIWSWGEEILVGFVKAKYLEKTGHTYDQTTARDTYARSLDGGQTWRLENAYEKGQTAWRYNNQLGTEAGKPEDLLSDMNFTHPDFALTFQRQTNKIGPSHFYYSYDRGNSWEGPYKLPNLDTQGIATRTDYIVDGPHQLLAFVTVAKSNSKEGRVACLRTIDGGKNWERVSWLGPESEGFEIMPSSIRLSSSKILSVVRKRTETGQDLLASYVSTDNAQSWKRLNDPVSDTGRGGCPPALLKLKDGRLALGYIVRSDQGSRVCIKFSSDQGQSWSDEIVLRGQEGTTRDAGYPRMVQRPDGKAVLIYYWNNANLKDHPPFRYIAATIFDPEKIK